MLRWLEGWRLREDKERLRTKSKHTEIVSFVRPVLIDFFVKITVGSDIGGDCGLELAPRGSQREFRGDSVLKNLAKEANKDSHNGPRGP